MGLILLALLILVVTVALEDIQETLDHHSGGIFKKWPYAKNRWRAKYKNPDGPYNFEDRKWWARVGLVAFLDLWHLAKTVRIWIFCALLLSWAGLSLWWLPIAWSLYGGLHDHLFYGRFYKS